VFPALFIFNGKISGFTRFIPSAGFHRGLVALPGAPKRDESISGLRTVWPFVGRRMDS
jgi:hypothetical protein